MEERPPRVSRILLITAAGDRGGAEIAMALMASRFDRQRYAPVMAAPAGSRLLEIWRGSGFEVAGTPAVQRLRNPIETKRVIEGIDGIVKTREIDLVHTHGVSAQIHGGLAARRRGRPVVSHVRDIFDSSWTRNGLLHRLSLAVPRDATIAASAAVAVSLGRHRPCEVIPDLVDTETVQPVDRSGPLVLWCGRLQRWKGCHLFLDAAREVLATRPDTRFAVVGGTLFGLEPEYAMEIRRQAETLGLSAAVEFVGHVADARPWMRAASLLVHCSERPEPFGMVTAEAMIQQRPVVAFRHGGVADNVVDGATGVLVSPGDTRALAAAIANLLADDARRLAMGEAARDRAVALYGAEVVTRQVERVYDRVLEGRSDEHLREARA